MSQRILLVRNSVAVFFFEFGIEKRNGAIGGDAMAVIVGGVVGQRADRECEFVQVLCIAKQSLHKISASHVVRQVAEKMAAVWVIAHVLDDRAAVGIGLRLTQLLFSGSRKTGEQKRLDMCFPNRIDDGFVGEYGIGAGVARPDQHTNEKENENCAPVITHLACDWRRQ